MYFRRYFHALLASGLFATSLLCSPPSSIAQGAGIGGSATVGGEDQNGSNDGGANGNAGISGGGSVGGSGDNGNGGVGGTIGTGGTGGTGGNGGIGGTGGSGGTGGTVGTGGTTNNEGALTSTLLRENGFIQCRRCPFRCTSEEKTNGCQDFRIRPGQQGSQTIGGGNGGAGTGQTSNQPRQAGIRGALCCQFFPDASLAQCTGGSSGTTSGNNNNGGGSNQSGSNNRF